MTTPIWPTDLPNPAATNYQEQPQSQIIRSTVDAGIDKVRRRFTSNTRQFSCTWYLTHDQLGAFESWFNNDLGAGSLAFRFPKPRYGMTTGTHILARFYGNNNDPLYTIGYAEQYRQWQVTARLEQLP